MELNENIEPFPCLLRSEYLYNLERGHGSYVDAIVFAVCGILGRAPSFHCLLKNGAQIGRLPISAFCWAECIPQALEELVLWNSFSHNPCYIEYGYLSSLRCLTSLRSGELCSGRYMFTIDWHGTDQAENPGPDGWKCHHVIRLDNGNFAMQPNNRLQFFESSFVTAPFAEKPDYLINTHIWDAENERREHTEDTDRFFYRYEKEGEDGEGLTAEHPVPDSGPPGPRPQSHGAVPDLPDSPLLDSQRRSGPKTVRLSTKLPVKSPPDAGGGGDGGADGED